MAATAAKHGELVKRIRKAMKGECGGRWQANTQRCDQWLCCELCLAESFLDEHKLVNEKPLVELVVAQRFLFSAPISALTHAHSVFRARITFTSVATSHACSFRSFIHSRQWLSLMWTETQHPCCIVDSLLLLHATLLDSMLKHLELERVLSHGQACLARRAHALASQPSALVAALHAQHSTLLVCSWPLGVLCPCFFSSPVVPAVATTNPLEEAGLQFSLPGHLDCCRED
jgi:hypothetical protein